MRRQKLGFRLFVLLLAASAVMIFGPACNTSDSILGPEAIVAPQSPGTGACVQSCREYAIASMAREQKRYEATMARLSGNSDMLRREQLLHKRVREEIQRDLRECRRTCPHVRSGS